MQCFVSLSLVVSTSAIDCLERLVSEMTYYVSSGMLNHRFIYSIAGCVTGQSNNSESCHTQGAINTSVIHVYFCRATYHLRISNTYCTFADDYRISSNRRPRLVLMTRHVFETVGVY